MASRTRRALFSLVLFLGTCAFVGSFVSQRVNAQASSDESTLRDALRNFTDVYAIVEQNYSDKLDSDHVDKAVYDGAIPGMLNVLDPHSHFYDPKAFAAMREEQNGRYYGVGMSIRPMPDKNGILHIVVEAPFEGTPAYKAGIHPGDVIISVDGKSTDGLDSAGVANLLKGPRGTHVQVTMKREGADKPLVFDLIRDEIPHPSVDLAYLIQPGIGYIHVANFSSDTTAREVGDALTQFGPIHGLLIDLRENPGGLLNQAVEMCDKFLQKGQVVVSQRGRAFPDQVYRASRGEQGSKYPIVVLVNRDTASAAEIVSGALQDHDRALIVGETTFGKGLVQTVFTIDEDTGLALTTYHYYTPSGRLIQRNYAGMSLYDYYYVRDGAPKDNANREVKLTDSGRTVYGGGGITPDEKIAPIKPTHFQEAVAEHGDVFFNFAPRYLATHTIGKDFTVDDAVLNSFKDYLKSLQVNFTDADIAANIDWVRSGIKSYLFAIQFGQTEGMKIRADADPQIEKAITFMPEAQALEDRLNAKQGAQTASR